MAMPTWNELAGGAGLAVILWRFAKWGTPKLVGYFEGRWTALELGQTEMLKTLDEIKKLVEANKDNMASHLADEAQWRRMVEHRLTMVEGEMSRSRRN